MNEIEKYQQASAEWMGFDPNTFDFEGLFFIWDLTKWKPNLKENAYQREMIEDKLIDEGNVVQTSRCRKKCIVQIYSSITKIHKKQGLISFSNKFKPIAFMKAFMSYLDSQ